MSEDLKQVIGNEFKFKKGDKGYILSRSKEVPNVVEVSEAEVIGWVVQDYEDEFKKVYIYRVVNVDADAKEVLGDALEKAFHATVEEAEAAAPDALVGVRDTFNLEISQTEEQLSAVKKHLQHLKDLQGKVVFKSPSPVVSEVESLTQAQDGGEKS